MDKASEGVPGVFAEVWSAEVQELKMGNGWSCGRCRSEQKPDHKEFVSGNNGDPVASHCRRHRAGHLLTQPTLEPIQAQRRCPQSPVSDSVVAPTQETTLTLWALVHPRCRAPKGGRLSLSWPCLHPLAAPARRTHVPRGPHSSPVSQACHFCLCPSA